MFKITKPPNLFGENLLHDVSVKFHCWGFVIHWRKMKLFILCTSINTLIPQGFLLTSAFFRVLNTTAGTRNSQSDRHILSSETEEVGGEKMEGRISTSVSERGFHFCLHFIDQNLVTWPLAARDAGKCGFHSQQLWFQMEIRAAITEEEVQNNASRQWEVGSEMLTPSFSFPRHFVSSSIVLTLTRPRERNRPSALWSLLFIFEPPTAPARGSCLRPVSNCYLLNTYTQGGQTLSTHCSWFIISYMFRI